MTETTDLERAEIRLPDLRTGEIVLIPDVAKADPEELAAAVAQTIATTRDYLTDVETVILAELLRRLDRRGEWTWRVGDPAAGVQYEISSASPTAGTVTYDVATIRDGLRELVPGDVDPEAARAVLKRQLTIKCTVDVDVDLGTVRAALDGLHAIAGTPVFDVNVEDSETVTAAGVRRLTAMGGKPAALVSRAKRSGPSPSRRPKIKAKTKASS